MLGRIDEIHVDDQPGVDPVEGQQVVLAVLHRRREWRELVDDAAHRRSGDRAVALALGAAALGSLFISMSETSMREAFAVVLAIQALVAVYVAVGSRRLPDPRR